MCVMCKVLVLSVMFQRSSVRIIVLGVSAGFRMLGVCIMKCVSVLCLVICTSK